MVQQSIKMALKAILANKTRSILTMLGIIIGVFSLVVLVSLVNGATSFITDSVSSYGNDYCEISIIDNKGWPIISQDLDKLRKLEGVSEVGYYATYYPTTFIADGNEKKGYLYGESPEAFRIDKLKDDILYGRPLTSADEENHLQVAVIRYEAAKKIYGMVDVLGKTIKANGVNYTIVGVLRKTEGTFRGFVMGTEYSLFIPYSCFTRQFPQDGFKNIEVSFKPGYDLEKGQKELENFLYKRLYNDSDTYSVTTQEEVNNILGGVTAALAILFGGIATISLLVGGIGIMNIMLVSVSERTREIGIRKAIGADTKSILLQFLIEAFVISLAGCLIGLLFSYITIYLVNLAVGTMDIEISFHIPFSVVLLSSIFSLFVGLVFGLYPAQKAARKKPIEALRYDG